MLPKNSFTLVVLITFFNITGRWLMLFKLLIACWLYKCTCGRSLYYTAHYTQNHNKDIVIDQSQRPKAIGIRSCRASEKTVVLSTCVDTEYWCQINIWLREITTWHVEYFRVPLEKRRCLRIYWWLDYVNQTFKFRKISDYMYRFYIIETFEEFKKK